jgi:hypothetical protein
MPGPVVQGLKRSASVWSGASGGPTVTVASGSGAGGRRAADDDAPARPRHVGPPGTRPRDDATMVFLDWPGPRPCGVTPWFLSRPGRAPVSEGTPGRARPGGRRRRSWHCGGPDHGQLTVGEEPAGRVGPGHGHDRLRAAPSHQRRHPHQGQLALDRVAQVWARVPAIRWGPAVAEVACQDGQLQRVLAGGVVQPVQDLAGGRACRRVHGRADQDQATDPVGIPHGQINANLATKGLATSRTRPGSTLSPKPGRSIAWTGWWPASLAASGIRCGGRRPAHAPGPAAGWRWRR